MKRILIISMTVAFLIVLLAACGEPRPQTDAESILGDDGSGDMADDGSGEAMEADDTKTDDAKTAPADKATPPPPQTSLSCVHGKGESTVKIMLSEGTPFSKVEVVLKGKPLNGAPTSDSVTISIGPGGKGEASVTIYLYGEYSVEGDVGAATLNVDANSC